MVFLAAGRQGETRLFRPLDERLAAFSFSLYAIHRQLMADMAALLVRIGLLPATCITDPGKVLALGLAMTAISAVPAYAFGQLFESRTPQLSRALAQLLRRRINAKKNGRDDMPPRPSHINHTA
ncbi:hypothetical protein A8V01_05405 [Novosphingobium guangzhouense]|uniref:Uncharacterized protein n=1 Tax=Novosphingobium guangzhouense TaxID=1850347 RepID=A0A2K2FZ31_9SPHN|nr:hypothetical protein A8V01_05405 [Novosphingobium guangzhouense]